MESEAKKEDKTRKIWVIISLVALIALVLAMVKLFIMDPYSSNEKPTFDDNSTVKTNLSANLPAGSASQPADAQTQPDAQSQMDDQAQPMPDNSDAESQPATPATDPQNETTPPADNDVTAPKTTASPSSSDKFIAQSPVDISDIKKISKFRSCAEESFGKTSFQNQSESEDSSLEHYFKLNKQNVPVYAPFDGEIIYESSSRMVIEVSPYDGWLVNISDLAIASGLSVGSQVKSGDEIGKSSGSKIEVAVAGFTETQKDKSYKDYSDENLDSIFSHLDDSVSTEFSGKGITTDTIIIPKSTRDSAKCDFSSSNDADWVDVE